MGITFNGDGSNLIKKVIERDGRVYINETQYFAGISQKKWEYLANGYQICTKWLVDRTGRVLSPKDIQSFQQMVATLIQRGQRDPSPIATHTCDHERHRRWTQKPTASIQLGNSFLCLSCTIQVVEQRRKAKTQAANH